MESRKMVELNQSNGDIVYHQSGVLPYRFQKGKADILLISNLSGSRWVIPKGIIDDGFNPVSSAANEAYEEAGVQGRIDPEPIGEYRYYKWNGICHVQVFLMEITDVLESWPESSLRKRKWMRPGDVLALIDKRIPDALVRKMLARIEKIGV